MIYKSTCHSCAFRNAVPTRPENLPRGKFLRKNVRPLGESTRGGKERDTSGTACIINRPLIAHDDKRDAREQPLVRSHRATANAASRST